MYISLLLFSTLVDFFHGKLVGSFLERGNRKAARMTVASSAFINLSLLVIFKYTDFFIRSVNSLTGSGIPLLDLALPIGISFYTFQTMSYTIDVYRGEAPVQNNIISFGAYVSMFPQLIAGPIVRYQDIAAELNTRTESLERFSLGIRRFVVGLGKKVLLANQAGALWTEITAILPADRSVLMVWMGILAFAFQIYFDFSGYSDMAVGMGHMLGFHFPENFNYPYISKSITEFWRRWHISLGTWFKEYVYIPLGGSRRGKARLVLATMATFLVSGAWHGAAGGFLVWGALHGVYLLAGRLTRAARGRVWAALGQGEHSPLRSAVSWAFTLLLVFGAWLFFVTGTLPAARQALAALFSPFPFSVQYLKESITLLGFTPAILVRLGLFTALAALVDWLSRGVGFGAWAAAQRPWVQAALCYVCVFASLFFGAAGALPNIYFAF